MTRGRPCPIAPLALASLVAGAVLLILVACSPALSPPGTLTGPGPVASGASPLASPEAAVSIGDVGTEPSEAVVGAEVNASWEAYTATGARATNFAVVCGVTVTGANGSAAPAWVNSSATGALARSANGTFTVPSPDWDAGRLRLSVDLGWAAPVSIALVGSFLPSEPAPIALVALPDVDHLVLSDPSWSNRSTNVSWSTSVLWHVRDRFGDPAWGATLLVELSTASGVLQTFVPVVGSTGGGTVARVNASAPNGTAATLTIQDAAGTVLFGPVGLPTSSAGAPGPSAGPLPTAALAAVALLGVGGFTGIGALLYGGRAKPSPAAVEAEEELRRLAEGRATVVEIVREGGALSLAEIEARWEPPPAPPAVADWVASLVTDGTLVASMAEGGRARFAVALPPPAEPRVTLDEQALEEGIARRDAAVGTPPDDGTQGGER